MKMREIVDCLSIDDICLAEGLSAAQLRKKEAVFVTSDGQEYTILSVYYDKASDKICIDIGGMDD